jgi:hypothetical protein
LVEVRVEVGVRVGVAEAVRVGDGVRDGDAVGVPVSVGRAPVTVGVSVQVIVGSATTVNPQLTKELLDCPLVLTVPAAKGDNTYLISNSPPSKVPLNPNPVPPDTKEVVPKSMAPFHNCTWRIFEERFPVASAENCK